MRKRTHAKLGQEIATPANNAAQATTETTVVAAKVNEVVDVDIQDPRDQQQQPTAKIASIDDPRGPKRKEPEGPMFLVTENDKEHFLLAQLRGSSNPPRLLNALMSIKGELRGCQLIEELKHIFNEVVIPVLDNTANKLESQEVSKLKSHLRATEERLETSDTELLSVKGENETLKGERESVLTLFKKLKSEVVTLHQEKINLSEENSRILISLNNAVTHEK